MNALANLRHLYANLVNGAVKDAASAKRIASGLLGPAITELERAEVVRLTQARLAPDAQLLCDTLKVVTGVAITMLYEQFPEDVCARFSLDDLNAVVLATAAHSKSNTQVESIYRQAWDLATQQSNASAATEVEPIPMVLHCPNCLKQHIDEAESDESYAKRLAQGGIDEQWTNPPHRSHLCRKDDGGCGFVWRPADVATTGVQAVATKGSTDSPVVSPEART